MIDLNPLREFELFEDPKAQILIIYTGGTLGMDYNEKGELVPCAFDSVLRRAPSAMELHINMAVISFETPIDSSNVEVKHWQAMAQIIEEHYDDYDGFLILHGTDTMAYSASALSFMLNGLNKPVIFTGAQLPIASPRSDATENLVTSLEIASDKKDDKPIITEVAIFFNNVLLRGNRAKKVESQQFDAFESENYPPLAKAGITINYNWAALRPFTQDFLEVHERMNGKVAILKLFPGIQQSTVELLLSTPDIEGIVLESYGSGNVPHQEWFLELLRKALQDNKLVFNVSQCNGGKVTHGKYETSGALDKIGVLSGADITTEAAITKMMYALGRFKNIGTLKKCLITPVRGEMY